VGLTLVEPLADEEPNPPGEIEIEVAPVVVQLSVLLAPESVLVGFAVKEPIEGAEPVPWVSDELVVPPQLARPTTAVRIRMSREKLGPKELYLLGVRLLLKKELAEPQLNSVVVMAGRSLLFAP
jgi:hypothetical protein